MTTSTDFPLELPLPRVIKYIVCCDVDETYIPTSNSNKLTSGIRELEKFLITHAETKGILIGWITGSNRTSVQRKAEGYISLSPHFLCSSLGTDFSWIKNGELVTPQDWTYRMAKSNYSKELIHKLVRLLNSSGVKLERQSNDYQGSHSESYYYHARTTIQEDLLQIISASSHYGVRASISKCNPAAGDPTDCHDVVFTPSFCGKDGAINYLMKDTGVTRKDVIAFGDSENDLPMFRAAGRGYLVSNAEPSLKAIYKEHTKKPYCLGILSILEGLK